MTATPAPPRGEYDQRLTRVQNWLAERDLDGAVLSRPENLYYLTNFRAAPIAAWTARFLAVAVPRCGDRPRLLARALEAESATRQWTPDPLLCVDHDDPYAVLAAGLREDGWDRARRVGVEEQFLSVAQRRGLQTALPGVELVDVSGAVEALAAQTSAWEAGCIRRAAEVTTAGMDRALAAIDVGVYPYEVVGQAQEAMYAAGQSDFEKSFVAVWSGPRGGMMHDTRTTERVAEGDVATVEIMGVDQHYTACAQTSVAIGSTPPSAEVVTAYELVIAMHDAARAAVCAGASAGSVFAAADALYREHTGEHYFRRVGGSLGLTLFALDLVKDNPQQLSEGLPLLVQVLVNAPVLLTCTSSVLVTATGCEELTPAIVSDQLRGRG